MDTTTLTIAEYAKAVGISRQAAYNRLKAGKLAEYVITTPEDGKTVLDGRILAAAEAPAMEEKTPGQAAGQGQHSKTIDFLVSQIELKDKQIAVLQETVSNLSAALKLAQTAVQASQTLHAADLNILPPPAPEAAPAESGSPDSNSGTDEPPKQKSKSFWKRLFG